MTTDQGDVIDFVAMDEKASRTPTLIPSVSQLQFHPRTADNTSDQAWRLGMIQQAKTAPPYSVVIVNDPTNKDVPSWREGSAVLATESCVAIACRAETDGETTFTLAPLPDLPNIDKLIFEGFVPTPSRRITIQTAEGETILEAKTTGSRTKLAIWCNDPLRPDDVVIGFG